MSTNTRHNTKFLAHPKDIHCVIFHVLNLLAYGAAFWLYLHPEVAGIDGIASRLAFVGAAALMLGWISGINVGVNFHNHAHRGIFNRPWMNRWFGRIWTFSGGWPSFFWQHSHVVVHHANVLEKTDWTLPRRRANGEWEGILTYSLLHWPFRYIRDLWTDFKERRNGPDFRHHATREFLIFMVLWSIPFFIDPFMALALWVLPHYLGNVLVMAPGMYAQHAGCHEPDPENPHAHSNTFTSKFFNLTMFNIGYHIEHHEFPLIHWSELPSFHQRFKADLLRNGGHVVPFGYYGGGRLLSSLFSREESRRRFMEQHNDYPSIWEDPSPTIESAEEPVEEATSTAFHAE